MWSLLGGNEVRTQENTASGTFEKESLNVTLCADCHLPSLRLCLALQVGRMEGTASVNTSMCCERPCWTLLTDQAVCFVRITENLCEDPLPMKSNQFVRVAGLSSLLVKVTDRISTAGFLETRVKTGPFHLRDVTEASVSSDSQSPGLASAFLVYTPVHIHIRERERGNSPGASVHCSPSEVKVLEACMMFYTAALHMSWLASL